MSSNEIIGQHHNNHNHRNGDYNVGNHKSHKHHHHELIEEDSIDEIDCQIPDIKEFDPKIRDLLDDLNRYSTKINQLEQCFQEENSRFHRVLNESSVQLNKTLKKCGERNVSTSRPYYEALQKLNDLKIKCQTAALKFEKFNELYMNAKQAISDAELMFHKNIKEDGHFDQYWQEKLNIANAKFMEAKLKREEHELEHLSLMAQIRLLEYNATDLKTKYKSSIKRAKSYFDEAHNIDLKLKKIRDDTKLLEEELAKCKSQYSTTLKNLENISEEIHEKRAQYIAKSLKREPGVGAEIIDQNCLEIVENLAKIELNPDEKIIATQTTDCHSLSTSSSLSSTSSSSSS
ncbi:SH3 domain-binding protein 5 homolog [Dermatophagoides farinae]|uniref:SH3 domain-binding protein 5 homolog n=1 Tax=Dermatophagoides farinae TaxID=6954 RepID=UPI003F63DDF1